ncbi:MAG TPA: hypothetical protein VF069_27365, partial [Streptosporangiaceae bacterium]
MEERVAAAARLIGSVRGTVAAKRARVHDVDDHEQVHWLAELPGEVPVHTGAGPGGVLFSLPPIALSPPAPLGEEFDSWLVLRRWYRVLRALAEAIEDGAGDTELVLATGLLSWRSGGGRVRDHLLTTPAEIVVDATTDRVDVLLGAETTLRDADLLRAQAGFDQARTEWVGEAVRAGQGFGLRASVADVLRKWCELAFDEPAVFREDWAALADGGYQGSSPRVRLAPALVLRKRERPGVLDYFDAILADLARPGASPPAGLMRLVDGEPAPARPVREPLFPLPAESAERQIMAGLRDALPVEGRLTTRSLANLGAALLAEGRRVLFVTPRNVRDVLPPELAELFGALPSLNHDPVQDKRIEAVLSGQVAAARREVAELRERAAVAAGLRDLPPGYRGTVAEVRARVGAGAEAHSWLPPGLPAVPPISAAEAGELFGLLAGQTPERAARGGQRLPDEADLPPAPDVQERIAAEQAAQDRRRRSETDLSRRLWNCELATRAGLSRCAIAIRRGLREIGHAAGEWDTRDWAVRALADGLAGRNSAAWEQIAANAPLVTEADRAVRAVGFQNVRLPAQPSVELLTAARQLRAFLVGGGRLRRGPMKPEEQRRAEPLLNVARVDGEPPTAPALLDVVIAELAGRMACRRLAESWAGVGVGFSGTSLGAVVDQIAAAYARLTHVQNALAAVRETAGLLADAGVPISLSSGPELLAYLAALDSLRFAAEAARAEAGVAELVDRLERLAGAGTPPPELTAAIAAVAARDAEGYARCVAALADARGERREQARCEELAARLPETVRSVLAAAAAEPQAGAAWRDRLAAWDEAWAWSAAAGFLAALEERESADLAEATARERAAVTELIAARARRLRGGTPVRALLLDEVTSMVEPVRDAYDVVIVDEADATDVSALYLLWLAPRLIAIGFRDPAAAASPLRGSLFDVLVARCGPALRLTDGDRPPAAAPPPATAPPPVAPASRARKAQAPQVQVRRIAATPPPAVPIFEPPPVTPVFEPAPPAVPVTTPPAPTPVPTPPVPVVAGSGAGAAPAPATAPGPADSTGAAEPTGTGDGTGRGEPDEPAPGGQRSIATYKRAELIDIVARAAADGAPRDDDELVEAARALLDCPPDEDLLVGARLHYAVTAFRQRQSPTPP